jgi:hypothetical protein
MLKLTVYVPARHLAAVKRALFAAGAGRYPRYDCCCWQVRGEGQFRPLAGSRPFVGARGTVKRVPEYRVEMLCPENRARAVVVALRRAHPYEEPAYDFVRLEDAPGASDACGRERSKGGKAGRLPRNRVRKDV